MSIRLLEGGGGGVGQLSLAAEWQSLPNARRLQNNFKNIEHRFQIVPKYSFASQSISHSGGKGGVGRLSLAAK